VLCLAFAAASVARAGTDPGLTCRLRQLSAASRLYRTSHVCWAKAYAHVGDPSSCLVKAEDHFRRAYTSAAASAQRSGSHCGLRLDVDSLLQIVASDVDPSVGAIASDVNFGSPTDLKFRARLMSAAGDLAARAFSAEIAFARRGDDALRTQQLAEAVAKFQAIFQSGESSAIAHGILYDGPPASTVSDSVQGWAAMWERITRSQLQALSLSGTIYAAESTFVDSDVNDTNVPPVDNGTLIEDAQPLPVPSTVGGYVNLAGAGAQGNSFTFGDAMDRYHVTLNAGQVVLLTVGDPVGTLVGTDSRLGGAAQGLRGERRLLPDRGRAGGRRVLHRGLPQAHLLLRYELHALGRADRAGCCDEGRAHRRRVRAWRADREAARAVAGARGATAGRGDAGSSRPRQGRGRSLARDAVAAAGDGGRAHQHVPGARRRGRTRAAHHPGSLARAAGA